jgi:CRISPR/Cas system-associated endonuclease/helicase Cas3
MIWKKKKHELVCFFHSRFPKTDRSQSDELLSLSLSW